MKRLISENPRKVLKAKAKFEKELKVKVSIKEKEIHIDGKPEDEYYAEKIVDAINLGFPIEEAFLLKEDEFVLEILNIKDYTKRKDLGMIKARIIGTKGKTLRVLSELTKCYFQVKDSQVGIIGDVDNIKNAGEAVVSIIKGSKHSKVYNRIEKHKPEPIFDLGLKKK